jgi:hypothetical protein
MVVMGCEFDGSWVDGAVLELELGSQGADGRDAATIPALALLYVLWDGNDTCELLSRVIIHKLIATWLGDGGIRQISFT